MIDAKRFRDATGREPIMDELDRVNCRRVGNLGHFFCGWCDNCQMPRFICGHPVSATHRQSTNYACTDCGRLVLVFGNHRGTLCSTCEWIRQSVPLPHPSSVRKIEAKRDVLAYPGALMVLAMAAAMGWPWFVLIYLTMLPLTLFAIAAWEREGTGRHIALPLLFAAMWPVSLFILLIRLPFEDRYEC